MSKIMISLSAATKAQGVADLEVLITRASKMYYVNGRFLKVDVAKRYPAATQILRKAGLEIDPGVEQITDEVFDLLWEVLKELKPSSKVLVRTGVVVNNATKTKLPYAMNGLDQKGPSDIDAWLAKHPGPYVVSDKLDGVSFEQVCIPGKPPEAYTKGNSDMGNRITRFLPMMNVPQKVKSDVAVRAEMIMKEKTFHAKHSKALVDDSKNKKYENPRNMVAGATSPKRKDLHPALADIDVVAYELLKPRLKPSAQLKMLETLGFKTAPHKIYKTLSATILSKLLEDRRKVSHYELDGLVVAQDKTYPIATNDDPAKHMVKFKFNNEASIVEVKVKDVVWEGSKHGKLIPRVNIPSTRLAGVTVDWATGHNAFFIANGFSKKDVKKNLPVRPVGPGATIRITRSGDVIPYIVEVVKGVKKAALPAEAHKWGKSGVHIFQSEKSELSAVKRITYFFSKLDVEGLKQGTVQKLYDQGLTSILKIVKAKKAQIMASEGIQDKTATKILANMQTALAKMTLPALMDASGLFGMGMGEKRVTWVLRKYPDILSRKPNADLVKLIDENVKGFSSTLAAQFVAGIPKFNKWYAKLNIKAQSLKPTKIVGKAFRDKTVAWTGFRNAAQELKVAEHGGTVGSGVSSKTSILVIKDASFTSSKVVKAKAQGIQVYTNAQFQSILDRLK